MRPRWLLLRKDTQLSAHIIPSRPQIGQLPPQRLQGLRLLITDVDGVLTDGGITYTASGEEIKTFDVKDGAGIKHWQKAGGKIAFLTGRGSPVVARRAAELGIDYLAMNAGDKLPVFQDILHKLGVTAEETIYVGDDWPDIPCLQEAGVGVAVADATRETLIAADAVTGRPGGRRALREVIDAILYARGVVEALTPPPPPAAAGEAESGRGL